MVNKIKYNEVDLISEIPSTYVLGDNNNPKMDSEYDNMTCGDSKRMEEIFGPLEMFCLENNAFFFQKPLSSSGFYDNKHMSLAYLLDSLHITQEADIGTHGRYQIKMVTKENPVSSELINQITRIFKKVEKHEKARKTPILKRTCNSP